MRGLFLVVFAAIVVYVSSSQLEVVCPEPIFGKVSTAPHPCNCSVYYECRDGEKYAKLCPSPYLYNQEAQLCDWPQRTKCKIELACLDMCQCTFSI